MIEGFACLSPEGKGILRVVPRPCQKAFSGHVESHKLQSASREPRRRGGFQVPRAVPLRHAGGRPLGICLQVKYLRNVSFSHLQDDRADLSI